MSRGHPVIGWRRYKKTTQAHIKNIEGHNKNLQRQLDEALAENQKLRKELADWDDFT